MSGYISRIIYFKTSEEFGTSEEWESNRYLEIDDPANITGQRIDAIGKYPNEGRYDFFCKIEDGLENEKVKFIRQLTNPLQKKQLNKSVI